MADEPSRLLTGNISYKGGSIPIAEYRNIIAARSLYNLYHEYESTQLFSSNNESNVASSISTVLNTIPQYNRFQVNTNLLGNVYDAYRDSGSPLARIGLTMLGKQILFNSAMNLGTAYIPSVDISQALKGNLKGIFKLNKDNTITVKNKEDKSFLDKVGSVASSVLGIDTYDVFGDANPFSKNPSNIDYIKNTGKAQLTHFYNAINMNLYKPINYEANSDYSRTFVQYAEEAGVTIDSTRGSILVNKPTFTFDRADVYPYLGIKITPGAIDIANLGMNISYSANTDTIQEYAPTRDYILANFGKTVVERDRTLEDFVDEISNFTSDSNTDNLVWGRDGVGGYAEAEIGQLRGDADSVDNTTLLEGEDNFDKLAAKSGLLEYTRNLLNATSGQFIDITRKAFKKDGKVIGYQGSPLWRGNNSAYSRASGTQGKAGVRQHTTLDPYGNDDAELEGTIGFAKSIRFKGNSVYEGSPNSVVNKTVLPRIHPTEYRGGEGNKNLMFSLENLAVGTIKRDNFGVIDDEYGTPIPLSEVGPFAGRMMWFPPYNIELNEVAIAKYESTVMVGRNEPMYNYMNSERTAVLSFSLLVDYPEQLRNINLTGKDKNKAIADFFAFGGDPVPTEYTIEVIEKRIETLRDKIPEIEGPTDQAQPENIKVSPAVIHFPNDRPTSGETDNMINIMYNKPIHYEIIDGCLSDTDGNGFGLNDKVYFIRGLSANTETTDDNNKYVLTGSSDQYSETGTTGQFGIQCILNQNLLKVFANPDTRKYYNIKITGSASKLYLSENEKAYNEALGDRRVAAAKKLVLGRLTALFGASVARELEERNQIETVKSQGSLGKSELGSKPENMHEKTVKEERISTITMMRNTVPVEKKEQIINPQQQQEITEIQSEIQDLELKLKVLKKNVVGDNIYNDRNKAILNSFESISDNQFYPVFHSQTPEDFHRRLTFLQQCTRQGAAKRYDIVDENTGELRARNSVFGRQPICILRVGDFWYTKVVIDSVTIDYADAPWDLNPESFGMQPMMASITLQMKVIGGQSLKGPIDALQNAATFNYYANSSFTAAGMYGRPSAEADKQERYLFGVNGDAGIIGEKQKNLNDKLTKLREVDK